MNVSELFIQCLENEGVTHIFGVPGEENEAFLFALENSKIQFVPTRHEQGAAFIANVLGRLTGKAGVCLATLGPGATNLVTGIADAYLDKSPVVAITGQGGIDRMHHESHQMIDIPQMFDAITKWNTSITDKNIITEVVRKAFKIAEQEKPGPTHIELPEDIAKEKIELQPSLSKMSTRRAAPDNLAVEQAASIISQSKKAMILAGNGAIRTRASESLKQFSEAFNIPVATTFMGKGAVAAKSKVSLGTVGLGFKDYIIEAFEAVDVVICIGYDIAEYDPKNWNLGEGKHLIHLDFEYAEVYREYVPAVEIVGDIANSIRKLHAKLSMPAQRDWYLEVKERVEDSIAQFKLEDETDYFNVPSVLHVVREVMDDSGLLISDVGSHKMWIARNFQTNCPNGCIISNGMASMGISLPGGIAAKIADENRQVIAMMGDGGAMMNIQELETAKRLGVGYTIIILNDNNYGLIEWKQERSKNKSFGTKLGNPDFVALAESFGIKGYKPGTISDLREILQKTLSEQELCVVEVPIDTNVNERLTIQLDNYFESKEKA